MTKGLNPEEELVKDDSDTPNVNFLGDLRVLWLVEAFWRLVPVGAHALARQLNLILILFDDLAEAEVGDFDLSIVKDDVLGLEVVVDYLLLLVCKVL